jgi:60 kDa SS-A/Ro ribonucleoprotein
MQKIHTHYSTKRTPQSEPMVGATTPQVQMRSGGHGWEVDDWTRLERFLILGTEGGTYYVGQRKLTVNACNGAKRCIDADGPRVVQTVVAVSDGGRAPSNDPALFVLAMCAKLGDQRTKEAAYKALPAVARIGTHLFHFAEYCKALGGLGGNGFKRAIARWYTDKPAERLAYQAVKYQQRDGWSHRDMLRLAHPKASSVDHQAIFQWITRGSMDGETSENVAMIEAFEEAKRCDTAKQVANLIRGYNLPREAVPTKFLNDPLVWDALLPKMPVFAMMRNLNKLTALGMVTNTSSTTGFIASVLGDKDRLVKARVHPLAVLIALKTYAAGQGFKGSLRWEPCARVIDVLDSAFYASFGSVKPTGKRLCLGLDVSGSMNAKVAGQPFLSCREAAAAMAMVTARVESTYEVLGFTSGGPGYVQMTSRARFGWGQGGGSGVTQLPISPRQRLDDITSMTAGLPFGGTDCALPILWAIENKVEIDAFVTITDNESWAGEIHVDQALREYRNKTGIPAKLVAVAMTADKYSVANPDDAGQMDVVGFDTATPNVISDFVSR